MSNKMSARDEETYLLKKWYFLPKGSVLSNQTSTFSLKSKTCGCSLGTSEKCGNSTRTCTCVCHLPPQAMRDE